MDPASSPPPVSPADGAGGVEFGERELEECRWLIDRAVAEDLPNGDATSDPLFPSGPGAPELCARFVPRQDGRLAGGPIVRELFGRHAPDVRVEVLLPDGARLPAGRRFLEVRGPARDVLRLERTALNFLGKLCGIASLTGRWVEEIRAGGAGGSARLLDTRKTTPGWRALEKYAVRCGGASNHRGNLSDGVLLKDNHIAILDHLARSGAAVPARQRGIGEFGPWVRRLRNANPGLFLQVEVDSREQLDEVLELDVDAVLLDNFSTADLVWAVEARAARGSARPLLEASGGIRLENVREIAATGVDRISVGALTHSAAVLDIGLDFGLDPQEPGGGS